MTLSLYLLHATHLSRPTTTLTTQARLRTGSRELQLWHKQVTTSCKGRPNENVTFLLAAQQHGLRMADVRHIQFWGPFTPDVPKPP